MKNVFFVAWLVPFATIIVVFLIFGAVLIAPFFLVGFILFQRKKNKRRNDILKLLNNQATRL